jgi:hypothetical protein
MSHHRQPDKVKVLTRASKSRDAIEISDDPSSNSQNIVYRKARLSRDGKR